MSYSDLYYDQRLQSLPEVLQEGAVEFDKVSRSILIISNEPS